ncbi:response regulator transcription factor [Candidatus Manganitrophus noduliformans]|uniref:Response regulator transcription factor n=1 Tax=Candidatus Manganitrophus noduliformans TaxID=2606439 RepID=A0A7X6IDT4_9BACT|nr:response regulator transcription factor [Candidatus Manganitrophus noduliformans]NKE73746.1 response regulator transcription factor [Candidatus Manganitrophus noduliformans]
MRVLLVEDDERVVGFIKRGLEAEHFQVEVAPDGLKAIEMATSIPYQMIILDLALPLKNGDEVCRVLREEKVQTPILMLTARDTVQEKVEGLAIGADDYLTKPFAFEELLARIKALLRRAGPYREAVSELRVADLVLNQGTHEVRRGDKVINLTAKEFALLEYLMRHPNRVLSRTAILEQVWGYQYDTFTNSVEVYVLYLRKKIDHGHSKKLIQTIRGVGYKISD